MKSNAARMPESEKPRKGSARYLQPRDLHERWILEAQLELQSPCHVGGPDADAVSEQPLLRDVQGQPFIPGTTLAGVMRARLLQAQKQATLLFGHDTDTRQGEGSPSALKVDDARMIPATVPIELRQGVSIDSRTGIAEDHKLYDMELLPVGARFSLRLELELPKKPAQQADELAKCLLMLLKSVEIEGLSLGKRTRRGYGQVRIVADAQGNKWTLTRYELMKPLHLLGWLLEGRVRNSEVDSQREAPIAPDNFASIDALAIDLSIPLEVLPLAPCTTFKLHAVLESSLLIRSGGRDPQGADAEHLHRPELTANGNKTVPILSGTSLAGLLRHQCLRIALTVSGERTLEGKDVGGSRAESLVDAIFGKGLTRKSGNVSRLYVPETPLLETLPMRHTRVRLDPWTGGALDTALFTHDACFGGSLKLTLKLSSLPTELETEAARALLLLALRDLVSGLCPVGGEGSIGRGWLKPPKSGEFLRVSGHTMSNCGQSEETIFLRDSGAFDLEAQSPWRCRLEALKTLLNPQLETSP